MQVVDQEPYEWFLFKTDEELLLDINCDHGAVGYNILIRLSPEETGAYGREGRAFLTRLAREIHNVGPGSTQMGRDVRPLYAEQCRVAIERWKAARPSDADAEPNTGQ